MCVRGGGGERERKNQTGSGTPGNFPKLFIFNSSKVQRRHMHEFKYLAFLTKATGVPGFWEIDSTLKQFELFLLGVITCLPIISTILLVCVSI